MKSRPHELNLDPNFDPLDPAQVSDPACWITGESADALRQGLVEGLSVLRHAPVMPGQGMDISDQVEIDPATGKYRMK